MRISNRRNRGFTLIELLVVIAIIAIIIAQLLPAVQQTRAAARRTQCKNNLKQLGLAIHNYLDVSLLFPGNITEAAGGNRSASWITLTLPYMDQAPAYNQMEFSGANFTNQGVGANLNWDVVRQLRVPGLSCPSSPLPTTRTEATNGATQGLGAPSLLTFQLTD